jgi:ribonuclease E
VRQLRLRDVGGIVVIDFIDMVLESNRELVLRRLTECLGRDRTKHQVAEVTSLGLVQMTRKRVGEGLLEAFSDTCEVCHGRGIIVHPEPVEKSGGQQQADDDAGEPKKATRRKRGGKRAAEAPPELPVNPEQRSKALAAMTAIHKAAHPDDEDGAGDAAELALDAVTAVLSGSELDLDQLADAAARPDGSTAPPKASDAGSEPAPDAPEAGSDAGSDAGTAAASDDAVADAEPPAPRRPRRRRAASRPAGPPVTG